VFGDSLVKARCTRNSSGDEIANVNFLYDDTVHAVQNTIDSCIYSATERHSYIHCVSKNMYVTLYYG